MGENSQHVKKKGMKFNWKWKVNSNNFPVFINYDVFFPDILPYLVDSTIFENKNGNDSQFLSVCQYSDRQNREEIRNSLMRKREKIRIFGQNIYLRKKEFLEKNVSHFLYFHSSFDHFRSNSYVIDNLLSTRFLVTHQNVYLTNIIISINRNLSNTVHIERWWR